MSNLSSKCGGGGWTLAMKLDPNKVKHVIGHNIQVSCPAAGYSCTVEGKSLHIPGGLPGRDGQ